MKQTAVARQVQISGCSSRNGWHAGRPLVLAEDALLVGDNTCADLLSSWLVWLSADTQGMSVKVKSIRKTKRLDKTQNQDNFIIYYIYIKFNLIYTHIKFKGLSRYKCILWGKKDKEQTCSWTSTCWHKSATNTFLNRNISVVATIKIG